MGTAKAIKLFKSIRGIGTFWAAPQTMAHLEALRRFELDVVTPMMPAGGRCLEIGSGAGWQARELEQRGYQMSGIDLATSNYSHERIWPVTDYDGQHIPFPDNSFDIVFSSNVLEHIPHVRAFQQEIHRVLAPEGVAVHVVPSSSWRWWTNLAHLVKCWTPPRPHGEHAGNAVAELFYFSQKWWLDLFLTTGWQVEVQQKTGLFYTGHSLMDDRWNIRTRHRLSTVLGSSCNIFVLRHGAAVNEKGSP